MFSVSNGLTGQSLRRSPGSPLRSSRQDTRQISAFQGGISLTFPGRPHLHGWLFLAFCLSLTTIPFPHSMNFKLPSSFCGHSPKPLDVYTHAIRNMYMALYYYKLSVIFVSYKVWLSICLHLCYIHVIHICVYTYTNLVSQTRF